MRTKITLLILSVFTCVSVKGQISPSNDTIACSSVDFTANIYQNISLSTDDLHSGLLNIGFTFNFYGNNYTQCVVSANGYISFIPGNAGNYSPWAIGNAIPSTALPMNAIYGPYQDIDPGVGGTIRVARTGTAPNRRFVLEYCAVPMFSCNSSTFTGQIILYEGSNNIETHITNKPLCSSWNAGAAIHGIQNSTGTIAHVVPGRNYPTNWVATNDAWLFSPTSSTNYTVSAIAFNPVLMGSAVSWTINGQPAGTSATITVPASNSTDTVIGTITGLGGCGTTTTTYIDTILVHPNPIGLVVTADSTLCTSNTGMAVASISGGISPITFNWLNPVSSNDTISNLGPGTYVVQVTDSSGCTITDSATVFYNTNINLSLVSSSNVLCNGDSTGTATTSISGASGSVGYVWNSGHSTASVTTLPGGYWTVIATDADGCSDSVTVTISQPPPITSVIYQVDNNCYGDSSGSAIVYPQGGVGNFTYNWATNPPQSTQTASGLPAGTYPVVITDGNGCNHLDTAVILEPQEITGVMSFTQPSCNGGNDGTATISNITGGSGPYNYTWQTTPAQFSSTAGNLSAGLYVVKITDANGCSGFDTIQVTEPPGMNITVQPYESACGHSDGSAEATVQGGTAPYSYAWTSGANTATATNLAAGSYNLTVTDAGGCSSTTTTIIGEYLGVEAGFNSNYITGALPFETLFNNTSTGASSYLWDFGTGDVDSVNVNPTYTFDNEGNYLVILYACYTNACCDTASMRITVFDEVTVPNVFTPDNDGVNDYFKLNTNGFASLSIKIFDRWGKEVFESDDVNATWDGNRKGGAVSAEGTYFYVINTVRPDGEVKSYQGTVTLLRGN